MSVSPCAEIVKIAVLAVLLSIIVFPMVRISFLLVPFMLRGIIAIRKGVFVLSDNEVKLGYIADHFQVKTEGLAAAVSDPEAQVAISNLQEEMFRALRLLENEVFILSRK